MPRSLFVGWTVNPPALVVGASEDSGINAGMALKAALAGVAGRGGGNARLAQGTAPSAAAIELAVGRL
jgi:alanyl-tRNA synthetase